VVVTDFAVYRAPAVFRRSRLFSGIDLLRLSARVIASLWSVNDEPTARLMETMYGIRQGQPTASGVQKPATANAVDRSVHVPADKVIAYG
jgi:hypothetical protein